MKIIFVTNFFTPHQEQLCNSLYANEKTDFLFIETFNKKNQNIPVGWQSDKKPEYLVDYDDFSENRNYYLEKIEESDVVILGSAPVELVKKRLKKGKLTFRYTERIYKKKCPWYELPLRAVKYYFESGRYKNFYLLCASAYVAGDYAKTGTFKNRAYKWGYFPKTKEYDIQKLLEAKTPNYILWAGRIIDWKHPEVPVQVAKKLKEQGYDFELNIIGTGDMDNEIKALIEKESLCENVHLLGSMSPEEVRGYMEKSKIYLFTSDRQEGWGAVLNEAMNSGCAVVASSAVGSAPYLIEDGKNGYLYKDGDLEDAYKKVKHLLDNPHLCVAVGEKAYQTITNEWNAKVAAERFVEAAEQRINKENSEDLYSKGILSRAEIIKDG